MTFTTGGANAQDTEINGGQRLTVTGRIDVLRGQGGTRHFKVPLTLAAGGQFNVEALSTALLDGTDTLRPPARRHRDRRRRRVLRRPVRDPDRHPDRRDDQRRGRVQHREPNTFVHQGGTVPGELQLQNGASLDPSGPGAATYHVVGSATLAGDVNAAATITAEASGGQPAQLYADRAAHAGRPDDLHHGRRQRPGHRASTARRAG